MATEIKRKREGDSNLKQYRVDYTAIRNAAIRSMRLAAGLTIIVEIECNVLSGCENGGGERGSTSQKFDPFLILESASAGALHFVRRLHGIFLVHAYYV